MNAQRRSVDDDQRSWVGSHPNTNRSDQSLSAMQPKPRPFAELLEIATRGSIAAKKPATPAVVVIDHMKKRKRNRPAKRHDVAVKKPRIGRAGKNAPIQQRMLAALSTKGWKSARQLRAEIKASPSSFHDARQSLEQAGRVERRGKTIKTEHRLTSAGMTKAPNRVPLSSSRAVRSGNTGRGRRS
jgi:hypothetical protein